jgi:hypothetical protein
MFRFPQFNPFRSTRHERRSAVARRPAKRIARRIAAVEALEGRAMLSYLVTNLLDDGSAASLRYEINQADAATGPQTVAFAKGLHGTITLDAGKGPLSITNSITVNGPGANKISVSGGDATQVLNVAAAVDAAIDGLTIEHGFASQGGGIDNAGTLSLNADVITDNQANSGLGGGGILNEVGAILTLTNSSLLDNQATAAAGNDIFGGGLLNQGQATVSDSSFQGNQAVGGGGFSFFGGSVGGAIDNYGSATLDVTRSAFVDNQAVAADGFFGIGGAIENNSGPADDQGSSATIRSSLFVGNFAGGGGGATANGGAINNEGGGSTMTIDDSMIVGNRAIGGAGANGSSTLGQSFGGAILNYAFATMNINDSTIVGNLAQGGDHPAATTTVPGTGSAFGGGVGNALATLVIHNSTIGGNLAQGGKAASGPGGNGLGGAIENLGGQLTISGSDLSYNLARAGKGGGGANPVLAGVGVGGALDDEAFAFPGGALPSSATITDSTLNHNQAVGGSGAAGGVAGDGDAVGGAIAVGIEQFFPYTDGSTLTMSGSALDHNSATGGSGGDALGGAIAVIAGSTADISGSEIDHNRATGGARANGLGGGIYNAGTLTLSAAADGREATVEYNDARGGPGGQGIGGGVYNTGIFAYTGTVIAKNHASTSNDDIFG